MAIRSVATLILWSTVVVTAHVQEHDSPVEDHLVRGGMPVPTQTAPRPESNFDWVMILSRSLLDVSEHAQRDTSLAEYLFASSHVDELAPRDFEFFHQSSSQTSFTQQPLVLDRGLARAVYFAGLVLMGSLVCWMYRERGSRVILAVLCYMFSLSSMTLTIRNVYVNFDFHYPMWLTASHFLFTALIGVTILLHQQRQDGKPFFIPPFNQFVRGIIPVSLVFAISIGSANLGLLYTNAHFYEMVGATTALATAGLGTLMGKPFDKFLVPPVLLVTGGLMTCAFGELVFSTIGFTFCATAVCSRALKSIVQHQLMDGDIGSQLTPIQLVVWTSLPSGMLMSLWSFYIEGTYPFHDFYSSTGTQGAVLLTIINACILNTAALYVLQNLGPVAQQLAGQLKGVLSVLGSVALFREQVTLQQIVGYCIIVCGVSWYNRRDMWLKQQATQINTTASQGMQNETTKAAETSPLVAHQNK